MSKIQEVHAAALRVTAELVDSKIEYVEFHTFQFSKITVCAMKLQNGEVVTGESIAPMGEPFDHAKGEAKAREKARNKIWAMERYLLRQQEYELGQQRELHQLLSGMRSAEEQKALDRGPAVEHHVITSDRLGEMRYMAFREPEGHHWTLQMEEALLFNSRVEADFFAGNNLVSGEQIHAEVRPVYELVPPPMKPAPTPDRQFRISRKGEDVMPEHLIIHAIDESQIWVADPRIASRFSESAALDILDAIIGDSAWEVEMVPVGEPRGLDRTVAAHPIRKDCPDGCLPGNWWIIRLSCYEGGTSDTRWYAGAPNLSERSARTAREHIRNSLAGSMEQATAFVSRKEAEEAATVVLANTHYDTEVSVIERMPERAGSNSKT